MRNESQTIVISKYNCDHLKNELQEICISIDIQEHKFGKNKSIIVYNGYEFFFERFMNSISNNTNIDPDIVFKKGDNCSPGMYKLGSLDNKNYTSLYHL